MRRAQFPFSILILVAVMLASCGGSSNRQLVSIAISPDPANAKNGTVQLVATGTFSAPPLTVTPLAVNWSQSPCDNLCAVSPHVVGPISVTNAGLATCAQSYAGTAPVKATAPRDPNLPPDTENTSLVTGTGSIVCP